MSRGEFKRSLRHLDALACKFGFDSYAAIVHGRDQVLQDQSPFAPSDRGTYAKAPLYLWDFAKAVNEHRLVEMAFGTIDDWVLFVHLEKGVVSGHAIHALAHRFGDFHLNTLIDIDELRSSSGPIPIIEVPKEVQEAVKGLADCHFPDKPFAFVPPPLAFMGDLYRSQPILLDLCPSGAEA